MRQLRFATIGSVDDGKSTLIGRLLYDSKSIFEDQLEHVEAVSKRRGDEYVDLSLLTDGLRAEREQGITIDVAHRYFATPARSFVIMDCPGHVQYTRNMVTGASTADLAIILIDARHGVVEQTRRHSILTSLLGVPHLVVCVNKMDLVDYSEARFKEIREDFENFAARLNLHDVTFLPISALKGDNVVDRTPDLGWFEGPTLLHHLENVYTASDDNRIDVRFPVQYVIRPRTTEYHDYRGYAGTVAGGVLRVGDEIVVLPSGLSSTITGIDSADGPLTEAVPGAAVTILLADDLSVTRGDMICRPHNRPRVVQDHEAMLCWLDSNAQLQTNKLYTLKHTTRSARAKVSEVRYVLDISELHRKEPTGPLAMNDIARVVIHTAEPLLRDDYEHNRVTGSFILVDESTGATAAAGMLLPPRE
ncbi:MAG: GTP-binding protein [Actinobacteria bacterium]|nr:GTP-binding protein [Actinomycetota bacterium]